MNYITNVSLFGYSAKLFGNFYSLHHKKTSDSPITRVSLISFDRLCIAPQST